MFVDIIKKSNGQHFKCRFTKKNGEIRDLYGCLKHKKDSKGLKYNPNDYNLICVFDIEKDQYRMINIPGIISLTMLDEPFEPIV